MRTLIKWSVRVCLLWFIAGTLFADNNLKIVFRYDDFLLADNHIDSTVLSIFRKFDIPLTVGVVPFDRDGRLRCTIDTFKLSKLRDDILLSKIEIALHGYRHLRNFGCGEFDGLPYEEQVRQISQGKRVLDSLLCCDVSTFIPPWNSYDSNTIRALENGGFKVISSALFGCQSRTSDIKLNLCPILLII